MRLAAHLALALALPAGGFLRAAPEPWRAVDTVLPALAYGPACSSTISLQNLGEQPVVVDIVGHRSSGALVPVEGLSTMTVRLAAGGTGLYKLHITDEDTAAWARIRERVPAGGIAAVAVSGATECVVNNELHEASREVAYPMRSPWFSGEADGFAGEVILLINTTAEAVRAAVCSSSGSYYSVPAATPAKVEFRPVCSAASEFQIPSYGSRRFPIEGGGPHSQFSLRTSGIGIVLQMLKPVGEGVRIYRVDSTVKFGEEVPGRGAAH